LFADRLILVELRGVDDELTLHSIDFAKEPPNYCGLSWIPLVEWLGIREEQLVEYRTRENAAGEGGPLIAHVTADSLRSQRQWVKKRSDAMAMRMTLETSERMARNRTSSICSTRASSNICLSCSSVH
jgi:hypothetical protein